MAAENPPKAPLFETVGAQVAEAANAADNDEPKVVDEIESLCMNCHENVCSFLNPGIAFSLTFNPSGNNSTPPYQNSLLPRNCNHVRQLPAL
jgi:hypothetical protein